MSALSPSATSASFCPVAGFGESNVLPDSASTHCPSMKSWYWRGVSDAGCVDDINCTPSVLAADSGCEISLRCVQLYHKRWPVVSGRWPGNRALGVGYEALGKTSALHQHPAPCTLLFTGPRPPAPGPCLPAPPSPR